MADPWLRDVEELVEASVFHASPCRRLRERVIRDAAKASHRQKIGHFVLVGSAALLGVTVVTCVIIKFSVSSSADSTASVPAATPTLFESQRPLAETSANSVNHSDTVRLNAGRPAVLDASSARGTEGPSLGEALFRSDTTGAIASPSGNSADSLPRGLPPSHLQPRTANGL